MMNIGDPANTMSLVRCGEDGPDREAGLDAGSPMGIDVDVLRISKELRVRCRLAWNNWPDSPEARKIIAEHEARDPYSAAAWDRVVAIITTAVTADFDVAAGLQKL